MIIDDNLNVFIRFNFVSFGIVSWICLGIHVDSLSVSAMLEENAELLVGNHLEV